MTSVLSKVGLSERYLRANFENLLVPSCNLIGPQQPAGKGPCIINLEGRTRTIEKLWLVSEKGQTM